MSRRGIKKLAIALSALCLIFASGPARGETPPPVRPDGWLFPIDMLDGARITAVSANHVKAGAFSFNASPTPVLFSHPPAKVEFIIKSVAGQKLETALAIDPRAWVRRGDGVFFTVKVDTGASTKALLERYINPKALESERRMIPAEIPLPFSETGRLKLVMETTCGPSGNCENDWAGWALPRITTPGYEKRRHKNVLLIVADTLRADVLGCYGHPFIKTPNIDSLAEHGWLFKRAISQSGTTAPSHSSLFTSAYLKDHKVYDQDTLLGAEWVTLAEAFRKYGFKTAAAVSSAAVHPALGFGQGFDFYSETPPKPPYERDSAQTNKAAFDWLDKNHDKPFFMWVHYYDTHSPYNAPPPYKTEYYRGNDPRDPTDRGMDIVDMENNPTQLFNREFYRGITDIHYIESLYYGEVSYLDHSVGQLLQKLEALGIRDDTLIVFTADHGESLTEHQVYFTHLGLYDQVVHVPLIISGAGLEKKEIGEMVEEIDIYPTITDLMGLPAPKRARGRSLARNPDGYERVAVSEHGWGYMLSYMTGRYKFILHLKSRKIYKRFELRKGEVEMYDMVADPAEMSNIAREHPGKVEAFRRLAKDWLADSMEGESAPLMRDDIKKAIRALGYVQE